MSKQKARPLQSIQASFKLLLQDITIKFDQGVSMEVDALGAAALMRASPVFRKMLTHDMPGEQ